MYVDCKVTNTVCNACYQYYGKPSTFYVYATVFPAYRAIFLPPSAVFTMYIPSMESLVTLAPLRVYILFWPAAALPLAILILDALPCMIGMIGERKASKSLPHTDALPPVP